MQGPVPAGLRLPAAGRGGKGLLWPALRRPPQTAEMVRFQQIGGQSSQRYIENWGELVHDRYLIFDDSDYYIRRAQFGALLPGQILSARSDAAAGSYSLPVVPPVEKRFAARKTLQSGTRSRFGFPRRSLPSRYFFLIITTMCVCVVTILCACCAEELGDYDPERHLPGYVSEINLVLNQSEKLEAQVEEFHSGRVGALVGISSTQAVNAFLKKAATLDTYGVDPHPVKVGSILVYHLFFYI